MLVSNIAHAFDNRSEKMYTISSAHDTCLPISHVAFKFLRVIMGEKTVCARGDPLPQK